MCGVCSRWENRPRNAQAARISLLRAREYVALRAGVTACVTESRVVRCVVTWVAVSPWVLLRGAGVWEAEQRRDCGARPGRGPKLSGCCPEVSLVEEKQEPRWDHGSAGTFPVAQRHAGPPGLFENKPMCSEPASLWPSLTAVIGH